MVLPTPTDGSPVAELAPSSSVASIPIQSSVAANNDASLPGLVMSPGKMAGIAGKFKTVYLGDLELDKGLTHAI
jgi:hypothetical protein